MNRLAKVYEKVESIYLSKDTRGMGRWMWNNHVNWVKDKAQVLAQKYQASEEKVMVAALLHDLADARYERGDAEFESWGETQAKQILIDTGFSNEEIDEIFEVIIKPHSCRPLNLPTTIEGKVLATADALFHLQTSFFALLCYKNRPENTSSFEEWQEWFSEKVERDFSNKIFFDDERKEAQPDFDALKRVFGNKTLRSEE